jgi:hypothetical protein
MPDFEYCHLQPGIVDQINDPKIALSDSISILVSGKFLCAKGSWVGTQSADSVDNPAAVPFGFNGLDFPGG